MRRLSLLAFCLLAVACGGPGSEGQVTDTAEPPREADALEQAPDFTIDTLDGGVFTLSEGELPTVLNFWAPW